MKKALLIFVLSILCVSAIIAQSDTSFPVKPKHKPLFGGDGIYLRDSTWKIGGYAGLSLSQTALYQWSQGGADNFSFLAAANVFANYKKGKIEWSNNLDIKYGMVANGLINTADLAQRNFQKNIDILQFSSNVGYHITDHLFAAINASFLSQFSPSYDYSQTDTVDGRFRKYTVSKFAAPAVVTIGPGLTWKPTGYFTLFFSPIEGKLTFVAAAGKDTAHIAPDVYSNAYYTGVDPTRFGLQTGTTFMGQLGGELDLLFEKDIVKNVNWKSHFNVFFSYMTNNYNTAVPLYNANLDSMTTINISPKTSHIPVVHWDNDIIFKVNKFLSATLSTRFVYQYNAQVPVYEKNNRPGSNGYGTSMSTDINGSPILAYNKLQIFEQFGIGLALKL